MSLLVRFYLTASWDPVIRMSKPCDGTKYGSIGKPEDLRQETRDQSDCPELALLTETFEQDKPEENSIPNTPRQ